MLRIFLYPILLILLLCISSLSHGQSIERIETMRYTSFSGDHWANLKAQAKEEKKIIFVKTYTNWCGTCKWMERNTFTNDAVISFFNDTFINIRLNMEKKRSEPFGKDYPVAAYPTMFFIHPDGRVLHKIVGGRTPAELISEAKHALSIY